MAEIDDEESRLFIDENFTDLPICSSSRSTNTGNSFELDPFFFVNFQRFRTRSSQTELTSENQLVFYRHQSTSCQFEYFQLFHRETSTDETTSDDDHDEALVIPNDDLTCDDHA